MSQKGKHVKKNESSKMNNVNKRKRTSKRKNKRNYNDRDKSFKKKELLNEDEKDSKKVITKSDKNGNKKKSSKKNVFAKIVGNFSKKTHTNRGNSEKKKIKMSPLITKICVFIVVIIIVILVCVNLLNNRKEENAVAQTEEQKEEETIETSSAKEEPIEESVDTNIQQLITQIRTENDLSVDNFYFFYYNIEQKKYYFYNENAYFTAASTIKVPVVMLYYDKIANGELSLTDTLTYGSNDYEAGGGTTATDYSVGQNIPISYLLEQTIVNSDNTALNILIHNIGYTQCKEELAKYTDIPLIEDFYTSNVTNCSYYYDVLQYLYQNQEKYSELISYMKRSSGGMYLKENLPQYEVAHKYGSYSGYLHDYGIIYGQNTYLIGVFTKGIENASDLIAEIGQRVVECAETPPTTNPTETENVENTQNTEGTEIVQETE